MLAIQALLIWRIQSILLILMRYLFVQVFDSELFIKYRLPLGLDLSMNVYPLQRASNARSWDPPGRAKGLGETVFEGMTIALAVDPAQAPEW